MQFYIKSEGRNQRHQEQAEIGKFLKEKARHLLTDFNLVFSNNIKYRQNPKNFELVGRPFCDGFLLPKFKEQFPTMSSFEHFLKRYVLVKKVKPSGSAYFVRLQDEGAILTDDLL